MHGINDRASSFTCTHDPPFFPRVINVLYVKASIWENTMRRIQEAGGRMLFEDEYTSSSKNGSKVEPVSRKEPWYTWFSLWSGSLIASFMSSSPLRSPGFLDCFGRSISEQKKRFRVELARFVRFFRIFRCWKSSQQRLILCARNFLVQRNRSSKIFWYNEIFFIVILSFN